MSAPSLAPTHHPLASTTTTRITDALHRAILALDTNDFPLWTSAFTSNATTPPSFTLSGTTPHTGHAALEDNVFRKVNNLDTTHHVSNVRVSGVPGDGNGDVAKAKLTAAAQAVPLLAGGGRGVGEEGAGGEWESL